MSHFLSGVLAYPVYKHSNKHIAGSPYATFVRKGENDGKLFVNANSIDSRCFTDVFFLFLQ